jgi:hypothetical protein
MRDIDELTNGLLLAIVIAASMFLSESSPPKPLPYIRVTDAASAKPMMSDCDRLCPGIPRNYQEGNSEPLLPRSAAGRLFIDGRITRTPALIRAR